MPQSIPLYIVGIKESYKQRQVSGGKSIVHVHKWGMWAVSQDQNLKVTLLTLLINDINNNLAIRYNGEKNN